MNACQELFTGEEKALTLRSHGRKVEKYLPMKPEMFSGMQFNADFMRFFEACGVFHDFDEIFRRYCNIHQLSKKYRAAWVKIKSLNTVIEPWPSLLKEKAKQEELEILSATGRNGCERYVE